MSNLPVEPHDDDSAFGGFLSRLRPYPPPPGFRVALLYAAGGSILLLLAGLAASALPSSGDLTRQLAVGAAQVGVVLELFRAPSAVFAFFGLAGLTVTAVIGLRRRVDDGAGGVLTALTMTGIGAAIWAALGWLIVLIGFLATLALWLLVVALICGAAMVAFRAEWGMAIVLLVCAVLLSSWLQNATGDDPRPTADAARSSPAPEQSVIAPPVAEPAEPHKPPPPGLVRQRIALEARMASVYEAWQEVPYVGPSCDQTVRTAELVSLRDVMAQMRQRIWEAARNREPAAFRQVAADLDRVDRGWARSVTDPRSAYERVGRCPSAVGVMAFRW